MNSIQILSFYQVFIQFYRKMEEFENGSFKNKRMNV